MKAALFFLPLLFVWTLTARADDYDSDVESVVPPPEGTAAADFEQHALWNAIASPATPTEVLEAVDEEGFSLRQGNVLSDVNEPEE